MYGEAWSDALRNAACFDVVPFRTPNIESLSTRAWELAAWFRSVLEQVRPRRLICNGNGKRSPWAVLDELYGVEETAKWRVPPNVFLKEGAVPLGKAWFSTAH